MIVWMDGRTVDRNDAKISVFDHGLLYGDGVFEGIRIYSGRIFQCKAHMDRLFRSAEGIRLGCAFDEQQLTDAMNVCIKANGIYDGYIRLIVTRGPGTLGLNPFNCEQSTTIIIADAISLYSREMYERGLPLIITKTRRCPPASLDPRIKSLNYLNNTLAKIECIDAGVPEGIMLNEKGNVAEGTGDNIFIVKDGAIITPPPEAGILLGITRGVVIHLAKQMDLEAIERNITPADLYAADECFLTGTAAEVIAATHVDGNAIGNGTVGPITQMLLDRFHEFARTDEELPYEG